VGEPTNPGAQSIRSLMVRAWGIDGGWMWLAAVAVVFVLTCLQLRTAMKHKNNSAAMALAGISACLVSPFSWYHHWVWVFPLAIVVLISVNQALGKRLRGVIGAQVAALVSFAAMCIVLLPYVSAAFWLEAANRSLNHWDFQPWAMLFFTGSGILYIAFYALWGFIPGTQPSKDEPHAGQHAAQPAAQPQHHAPLQQGQPQHSQAQRTRAAGAPAPRARHLAGTACAIAANSGQSPHSPRTPGPTASSAPRIACTSTSCAPAQRKSCPSWCTCTAAASLWARPTCSCCAGLSSPPA